MKEGSCWPVLGGVQVKGAVMDELVTVSKDLLLRRTLSFLRQLQSKS